MSAENLEFKESAHEDLGSGSVEYDLRELLTCSQALGTGREELVKKTGRLLGEILTGIALDRLSVKPDATTETESKKELGKLLDFVDKSLRSMDLKHLITVRGSAHKRRPGYSMPPGITRFKVREFRKSLGMTQEEFAELLSDGHVNISKWAVNRIENGHTSSDNLNFRHIINYPAFRNWLNDDSLAADEEPAADQ